MLQRDSSDSTAIGVAAAVVYDVISATNSSPQTTEINAKARSKTLMKWVWAGLIQGGFFVLIMMAAEPPGKKWRPLIGGGLAMVMLWAQYVYALTMGLQSTEPPTEQYGAAGKGTGRKR